jgi:hypothetical protein
MAWTAMDIISRIFDLLLFPFKGLHPVVGLLVISIVTGIVMLVIFGKVTNQSALRRVKGLIVASIIEIWLFKDRPVLMFGAAGRILRHNLSYLRYSLVAVIFVIVPVVLIMVQLGVRYSHRPLHPSEEAIVVAKLEGAESAAGSDVALVVPDGLEVVTPALRLEDEGEINWKIKALKPGSYDLVLKGSGFEAVKQVVVVENSFMKLAPIRAKAASWDFFLYPAERPLSGESPLKSIQLTYPPSSLGGLYLFPVWLWIFFVVSIAAGFALKGLFKVEV